MAKKFQFTIVCQKAGGLKREQTRHHEVMFGFGMSSLILAENTVMG